VFCRPRKRSRTKILQALHTVEHKNISLSGRQDKICRQTSGAKKGRPPSSSITSTSLPRKQGEEATIFTTALLVCKETKKIGNYILVSLVHGCIEHGYTFVVHIIQNPTMLMQ